MHDFTYQNGRLACEAVDLESLAIEVGTPAYVYSSATILNNYRRMDAALAGLDHMICYAMKANSNIAILDLLAKEGAGFDIVSGGELFRVLAAGGRAVKTTFAGVGKTGGEIETALREGVYCLNVESEAELDRIEKIAARLGVQAPIAVRVNPDVDAGTHEFISTGKSKNKFGIGMDRADAVYERAAACPHVSVKGVQTHIGSQILDPAPFAEAVSKLLPLVNRLKDTYGIEFFSVGGGVGICYEEALASGHSQWWQESGKSPRFTPEQYAAAIVPLLQPLGLKILFEPGRSMVGNSGVLLSKVEYVKETPKKTFVIVDAAMSDLIRPALYEGFHEIVPLKEPPTHDLIQVDVVGPVCESGDFLAKDRALPRLVSGDFLAVMSVGAYGAVMGSTYNSRPLAPEILVEGDRFHVIRKRQVANDLIAGEVIPNR
ncbi:MAG: diaminopimelate decarboxylase [Terrimicrobiaceae bacterium]